MTAKSPDTTDERVALMAGSFNPFTIGHADIVRRGLAMFDRVIIAVGLNRQKAEADPTLALDADRRAEVIARYFRDQPRVKVIVSHDLTVETAIKHGARFMLRGIRSCRDLEYERDMADLNFRLAGLETVALFASPELAAISSSAVRDIAAYGRDVSEFLPD